MAVTVTNQKTTFDADTNSDYSVDIGAGAVGAGTQRTTLASDDPAVAKLTTIDVDTGAIATSVASVDGKITACNTGAVVVSSSVLPTGAATAANQQTDALTDTELRATPVPVSLTSTTITGTVAVTQSGTWDEVGINDSGNSITVDDGGLSLTVDGTVAATQSGAWNITNVSGTVSLPTGAATLAEQQTQTTSLQLIDDTVATLGTATYSEATTKGIVVGAIRRDADTSLVDTTNEVAPLQVDANGRLKVEAFSGETLPVSLTSTTITGTVTVSGTVTANAGTNLNTSALALESGGNLAAAATSLAVIDDWDESDRAKVNIIVGQAGITAGAGAVAANTPRVTHASDDPVTTALQIIDDWDESDRAKVNPIVGQAGVQGGSGAVSATTQRVTLATDVALPTGTNALGKIGHDTTAVADGRTTVTTAGTRVALAGSTSCKWVTITAETDNTGLIVVGGASTVVATVATRRGTPLYPGDSVTILTDNLADIGLDSTVSTDGVTYTYGT